MQTFYVPTDWLLLLLLQSVMLVPDTLLMKRQCVYHHQRITCMVLYWLKNLNIKSIDLSYDFSVLTIVYVPLIPKVCF